MMKHDNIFLFVLILKKFNYFFFYSFFLNFRNNYSFSLVNNNCIKSFLFYFMIFTKINLKKYLFHIAKVVSNLFKT